MLLESCRKTSRESHLLAIPCGLTVSGCTAALNETGYDSIGCLGTGRAMKAMKETRYTNIIGSDLHSPHICGPGRTLMSSRCSRVRRASPTLLQSSAAMTVTLGVIEVPHLDLAT